MIMRFFLHIDTVGDTGLSRFSLRENSSLRDEESNYESAFRSKGNVQSARFRAACLRILNRWAYDDFH
jgi:hypothetical protein